MRDAPNPPNRNLSDFMTTKKQPYRNGKARSSSGRLVRLSESDWRELKASGSRKGYATVRFNHRTGWMLKCQWKSWLKLAAHGLARIGPDGGEAEELCITAAGRAALKANDRDVGALERQNNRYRETLHDGYAVYSQLTDAEKKFTSADNVSAVLDAFKRVLLANNHDEPRA